MTFADKIESWYSDHSRQLPWRQTTNPYHIWLSEIILQQTRIEQGLAYYHHFVETYPTIRHLADASEEQVLKSWQGLGYYSRARNLHATARHIAYDLGGAFPSTYDEIRRLKGIGPYTAAAIASFAFRLPHPVIDGNVYRLVSRLYGIATPINTTTAFREFEQVLLRVIDSERPDLFNQALMDFGSTYCKPQRPDCPNCIFASECEAYRHGKVELLPVKAAPTPVRTRHFHYLDITFLDHGTEHTLVHQRQAGDIWQGLFEFPLIETETPLDEAALRQLVGQTLPEAEEMTISQTLTHKLTHRTILATFVKVKMDSFSPERLPNETSLPRIDLKKLPVSRLIDRYLNK